MLLVGGLILTYEVRRLVFDLLGVLFGTVSGTAFLYGEVTEPFAMLLATGAFSVYPLRLAARDRQAVPEVGAGATLRRWCVYLLALVGLLMLLFGTSNLLARLVEVVTPRAGVQLRTAAGWRRMWLAGRFDADGPAGLGDGLGLEHPPVPATAGSGTWSAHRRFAKSTSTSCCSLQLAGLFGTLGRCSTCCVPGRC